MPPGLQDSRHQELHLAVTPHPLLDRTQMEMPLFGLYDFIFSEKRNKETAIRWEESRVLVLWGQGSVVTGTVIRNGWRVSAECAKDLVGYCSSSFLK